jgi:hypothetical protein
LVRRQAEQLGVPPDLAQAVMVAESGGDPTRIGPNGEVGLMQLRLATAMMLGFRGTAEDLYDPALNASYGVAHLAQAWRIAGGDVCRTYVKFRAHYGEERLARFAEGCGRLRQTLAGMSSPLAAQAAGAPTKPDDRTAEAKASDAKASTETKTADAKAADPKPAEAKAAEAKPVETKAEEPKAKPVETAAVPPAPETKPAPVVEAKPDVTATASVAHPAPPARPAALVAARAPAPRMRAAAKVAKPVAKAAPAAKSAAKPDAKPEAKLKPEPAGVTLVAKTRTGGRTALTCQGRSCTLKKADR